MSSSKRRWKTFWENRDLKAANQASDYWVYFQNKDSPLIAEKLHWLEKHHLSFFREPPDQK